MTPIAQARFPPGIVTRCRVSGLYCLECDRTYIDQVLRLGRYEIEAEIGQGSMGVVYLANDPRVRRRLALKTYLLPHGLSREEEREFSERFLREAQAAGALSHPAIVTVYDADEDQTQGIPFIAMEYVPGRSLREVLMQEGRLSADRAISIAITLADALHAAHEAGIVHRDIKPANILVRESDGAVKIADFGVARLPTSELTRSGLSFGSPAYMAPEQFRGAIVDRRTDLFSLAVILYQALTGERPFGGSDLMSIAYAVVNETPVKISSHMDGLRPALDAFFDRALAKDPDDRFQTAEEFKRALEAILQGEPIPAPEPAAAVRVGEIAAPSAETQAQPRKSGEPEVRFRARAFGIALLILVGAIVVRGIYVGVSKPAPPGDTTTPIAGKTSSGAGSGPAGRSAASMGSPSARNGGFVSPATGTAGGTHAGETAGAHAGTPALSASAGISGTPGAPGAAAAGPIGQITPRWEHPGAPGNAKSPASTKTLATSDAPKRGAAAGDARSAHKGMAKSTESGAAKAAAGSSDTHASSSAAPATGDRATTVDHAAVSQEPTGKSALSESTEEETASESPATAGAGAGAKETGLTLVVKSNIDSGTLRILSDGHEIYSHHLAAVRKEDKGFWKKVFNKSAESFKAKIPIAPGHHEIVAILVPDGGSEIRQRASIELKAGDSHKIKLTAGKENGPPLILDAD